MARKSKSSAKANNTSISKTNSEKDETSQSQVKLIFLGEYFNIHTFKMEIVTQSFILRQAIKLKEWADQEDSLRICDFFTAQGYRRRDFYDFITKCQEMEYAHEYALTRIGSRREHGAVTRKFSDATIHRTLGHYDPVWREETKLLNEARLAVAEKHESKVVVIERFPCLSGGYTDIEVVSMSDKTPEEVAANVHRQTGLKSPVKVNTNFLGKYED